jgi:PIN domain nuclease of toxin-antitoxin system
MELLLDTHAVIWFITEDSHLPLRTKLIIESVENNCYVSVATFWEIAIKHSLGRLNLETNLENLFQLILSSGFSILPITLSQILENSRLPFHHNDPFDRIIIAQAIHEDFKIISKDGQFENYQVSLIWD